MNFGIKKRDTSYGSELETFRRSISGLFDDFFSLRPSSLFDTEWMPEIDVHEDNKAMYVKADMPGIEEKNIDVNIDNNMLTIKGEKTEECREGDEKRTIITERKYGSFQRSISLPNGIKADAIKAEFKNGVLSLVIPKEKVEEPKRIKINIK